jgi:hypothetical protein
MAPPAREATQKDQQADVSKYPHAKTKQTLFRTTSLFTLLYGAATMAELIPTEAEAAASNAAAPPSPSKDEWEKQTGRPSWQRARLSTSGRLTIHACWAKEVKGGNWRVLARVAGHTLDFGATTEPQQTTWVAGQCGGVLGENVPLISMVDAPLELTVWTDSGPSGDAPVGRPPVRAARHATTPPALRRRPPPPAVRTTLSPL